MLKNEALTIIYNIFAKSSQKSIFMIRGGFFMILNLFLLILIKPRW